jgi:YD repeat-containing protein
MMRRYSLTARRVILAIASTLIVSLGVVASAQAVVVNDGGTDYGAALVPDGSTPGTLPGSFQVPNASGTCADPSLSPDLTWATTGLVSPLCYHGGSVLSSNETYVLTWDPDRRYWATTRQYVEQFLSDVAAASGSFGSPFAVTPQYTMDNGTVHAQNQSLFAGGCIDYGSDPGNNSGYTCQFGVNHPSGTGNNYPANGCPVTGNNVWTGQPNGPIDTTANDVCLTDAQIKTELQQMLPQMGLPGGNKPGYQPLVDVLLPSGVEVCLDSSGNVCSVNSNSADTQAQFCSYHSQIDINGTDVTYVVQPWTAAWGQGQGCDDPAAPNISLPVDQLTLAQQVAQKLVSPLSQGQLAAITDPGLDGWYGYDSAENGTEINDNGCGPLGGTLDNVTINGDVWSLQREFNNAGAIETDPDALPCTGTVLLNPVFVVPGPVEPGDNVLFDGSVTASTLMIHNGSYQWNFGDGTSGTGPSVYHQYNTPGNYQVTLKVTDRGGNTASITQTVQVLGSNGQPAAVPTAAPGSSSSSGPALSVRLQLLPQSLKAVLARGMAVRVSSNKAANGIATVWITRAAAKRAGISVGRKAKTVRIGIGTVASITNGTVVLHLHLARPVAKKLGHLGHVTMTLHLSLVAAGNQTYAVDAAAHF